MTAYRDAGQYPQAYSYLKGLVRDQMIMADADTKRDPNTTATWLDRAAAINANDGSFSSEFVRGATREAGYINGTPISEQRFQEASDKLAQKVIADVLDQNGVPKSDVIVGNDVQSAVNDLGLQPWQWAGTWGDILPPSLGGLGKDYQSLPPPESARQFAADWLRSAQQQLSGFGRWEYRRVAATDPFTGMPTNDIDSIANTATTSALSWTPRRDPLVLDLDGDGLELVGASSSLLFDHNADDIRTGTGWVNAQDGLLVRDINGNGKIDTGRELFGVDTLKTNGSRATDGFDALRDLDSNHDGFITSADAAFGQLKVWRDQNQDGVSQAGELKTVAEWGITSIGVNGTSAGPQAGQTINNNLVALSTTFTQNGAVRTIGAVDLDTNNFYSEFSSAVVNQAGQAVAMTAQVQALPQMNGSGMVRNMHVAASLDSIFSDALQTYAATSTADGERSQLDSLLTNGQERLLIGVVC